MLFHYHEISQKSLCRIRLDTKSFVFPWKTARRAFNLMTSLARKHQERHDCSFILCDIEREVIYASTYLHSESYASMHHARSRLCNVLLSSSRILSTPSLSCQQDNVSPREHECLYPSSLYNEWKWLQLKINFNPH